MKRIITLALCLLLVGNCALALAGGGPSYLIVWNPSPEDRLNLREGPSTSSASLGKYYSGVIVRVLEEKDGWYRVQIGSEEGGASGWMKGEFLVSPDTRVASTTPTVPLHQAFQVEGIAVMDRAGMDPVLLYRLPAAYPVTVLGVVGDNAHIQFGGKTGFVNTAEVHMDDRSKQLEMALLTLGDERIELRDADRLAQLAQMLTEAKPRGYHMASCPFEATLTLWTGQDTHTVELATDSCCIFRLNGYDYRYPGDGNHVLFQLFGMTFE